MPKFPAYPPMTSPDGADEVLVNDASDSNKTKRFSLTGLKDWLKTLVNWVTLGMIDLGTFPSFTAYASVSQTLVGGAAAVVFQANTELFDNTNNYNNATYTFTAPATGVYEFYLLGTGSNPTSSRLIPSIKIGATSYLGTQLENTYGSGIVQVQVKLTAGDTVVPYMQANPDNIPLSVTSVGCRWSGRRVA